MPAGWREVKLGDVAEIVNKSWKVGDEQLPYIGLEYIEENKLRSNSIGSSDEINSNKYIFTEETFLFGKLRPYFRKLFKPDFKGICSTDIWVVKPKEDVDRNWLFYLFANQKFVDLSYSGASGTRMPRANWDFVKNTKWPLPPLPEQKAIAEVLSSLDDKIDLLHRQNKTLEDTAQALFRKWFIEPVAQPSLNPSQREGNDEADEGWEEKRLGDVVNIRYGKNLPTIKLTESSFPVFGGNGQIGFYSEYHYEKPQVLVSCRGEASGKVNISSPKSFITNNSLVLEIPENSYLTFEFLKYFALSTNFRNYVSGSAQPQITIEGLTLAKIRIPDKELIKRFTDFASDIEEKLLKNQSQIRTLENLRDTLLPKLMSGEVEVRS